MRRGQVRVRYRPHIHRGLYCLDCKRASGSLREYLAEVERYTLDGRLESIRCPTLVTVAEGDMLAHSAPALFEALSCPKQLLHFSAAEGAGGHCEMGNRSLRNQRVLDWLDEQLDVKE
ncbi:hypothetical protein QTH97_26675 [Variovorax sp. J22R24]|uniref:hypothetical protein n=1 Tax=Variovorax gracilis TaxID=3053502 RepID=UPI00257569A0|nr:hypothetical protein [Variovorax sp. J22R24]MDM0108559.1 hypothetical protein [Variovorax sp. J22R24]